ncbi:MAG: PAS domain S-box protein [Thalassovita sp.]
MTTFGWARASVLVALLLFLLGQTALLTREVSIDLRDLATAPTDNVQWTLSQLEVELARAAAAMTQAQSGTPDGLADVRKRFDIFYSRVVTLERGANFAELRDIAVNQSHLKDLRAYLDRSATVIDGPEVELIAYLPQLIEDTRAQEGGVRALTLSGVAIFARQSDQARSHVHGTMTKMAFSGVGLILALGGLILVLLQLLRKGDRAATEKALAQSRLEAMVASSLDAILVLDTDGHILEFNGAAEEVFGYAREEALGQEMSQLIVPDHLREAHRAGMKRYLETKEKRVIDAGRLHLEAVRKSGEHFPVEVSITTAIADGKTVFVSFLRDIAQQVEAEAALKRARDEARAGEKAKSDLLTVMSHEMRTPLNGILGSVELIKRDPLTPRQTRNLEAARTSGNLLLSHVNDVLDLSRIDADAVQPKFAPFDLLAMLQELQEAQYAPAKALGNTITLEVLSPDLNDVIGDAVHLHRCLVNLVGNAVKFTQNGEIAIEVERLAGDMVEFRVADTGVGIPEAKLASIFDEFVTLDTSYGRRNAGTGLGLAITKRLVGMMMGEIDVDSIEGEGSLFRITLPLPPIGADMPRSQSDAPQRMAKISSKSLLVVEDNDINREIIVDMLHELGHTVEDRNGGVPGLERANEHLFDAIIMDISMPDMDGIEVLHHIKTGVGACKDVPVIAATAHAAAEDHARISEAGFVGIVTKPISVEQLEIALAQIFGSATLDHTAQSKPILARSTHTPWDDLVKRMGKERATKTLHQFQHDVGVLCQSLHQAGELAQPHRDTAHDLAGMAGLVGWPDLQVAIKRVEECDAADWGKHRKTWIQDIEQGAQRLSENANLT